MYSVGIDIGSSAAKIVILEGGKIISTRLLPTGFSSVETARKILEDLEQDGFTRDDGIFCATGYGRVAVPYANKVVTEISCHGKGAAYLFEKSGVVIDIGGQDTKIIAVENGRVKKFLMNDKCSAGTGRFLEIMANRLVVNQEELSSLVRCGKPTTISSMCTVFAESEIISLIGKGEPRENIAYGIIESIVEKVVTLASPMTGERYYLTGGLCENDYLIARLQAKLKCPVTSTPLARYAGALGAALFASSEQ